MTVASFLWGNYGRLTAKPLFAAVVSVVVIAVNLGLILGGEIWNVPLATEISELWIDPNSQVAENNKIVKKFGTSTDLGFNEFITLTSEDGSSMTKPENMQLWKQLTERVMDTVVEYNGTYFTVLDVCNGRNGQVPYSFGCGTNNPLDYFQDGSLFFPEEAVAQWLLDTKLAWAAVDAGQGDELLAKVALWAWAILADTASGGSITFYNNWFVKKCMKPGKIFCDDNDELYTQIDSLLDEPNFPKSGKFQFAWAKAQLMLVGMFVEFLPAIPAQGIPTGQNSLHAEGTCAEASNPYDAETDTTTDAITLTANNALEQLFISNLEKIGFQNGQTFSLANCAFKAGGVCPSTNLPPACDVLALRSVDMMNFMSPCASCILAGMWWNGDFAKIQADLGPSDAPAGGILTQNTGSDHFDITDPDEAKNRVLHAAGLVAPACAAFAGTPTDISAAHCDALWDNFYETTIDALHNPAQQASIVQEGAEARGIILAQYDFRPDEELIAVNAALGGRAGMDAAWRNLLRQGAIPPVKSALLRFEDRPDLAGLSEADIAKTLSGFKNDLLTQNLRAAVFGSAVPHPRDLVPGRCQCNPTWAGLQCQIKEDPICDCDTTLKPTCLEGLLASCMSLAPCAGYTTIASLVDNASALGIADKLGSFANFKELMYVVAGLQLDATASGSVLLAQCGEFLLCLDDDDLYTNIPSITAMGPTTYAGILDDASWNLAFLADKAASESVEIYVTRANILLQIFNVKLTLAGSNPSAIVAIMNALNTAGAATTVTFSDPANEFTAFACATPTTGILGCAETPLLIGGNELDDVENDLQGCPNTKLTQTGMEYVSVFAYFSCLAEVSQPPNSGRTGDSEALLPKGTTGSDEKGLYCGSMPSDQTSVSEGLTKGQCLVAGAAFLFQGIEKALLAFPGSEGIVLENVFNAGGQDRASAGQLNVQTQALVGVLSNNTVVAAAFKNQVLGGCVTEGPTCSGFTAVVSAVLDDQCTAAKNVFSPVALELGACDTLVTNLGGALLRDATSINTVSKALAKYKFMGTIFGACSSAGGSALGGGECWDDADCGQGTCANLSAAKPFESIKVLAMIIQTNSPNGTLSYMRKADGKYREMANKPIFDRYKARLEADSRRRLDDIDFGELGPVSWLTEEGADEVLRSWRLQMIDNIKEFRETAPSAHADVVSADSPSNLLDEISKANPAMLVLGYGLMLLYTLLSCTNWSTDVPAMLNGSRALVGMFGVILVALSVASGLGISHLAGVEWSAAATQIVPFVMLGLGVSDTFVLLRLFPYYQDGLSPAEAAAKALTVAGPPMLLVSVTNVGVFAIGVLTAMPVVVNFALQATIITITNYFSTNLMMPALLVLDYKRMAAGRMDLAPCVHVGTSARAQVASETTGYEMNVYNRFCTPTYAKCLLSIPGKIFVLAASFALLGSAIYGVEDVAELGLQLADIAPAGSDLSSALLTRDENFGFYTISLATGEANWAKREVQQGIMKVYADVMATEKVVDGSGNPWMQAFMSWGQVSTPGYDTTDVGQLCNEQNPRTGGLCGAHPLISCVVITADDSVVQGGIPFYAENDFYRCLNKWINVDLAYEALKPGFKLVDEFAPKGSRQLFYSRDDDSGKYLPFSTGQLITLGLSTNADFVQLINEVRAVANSETVPPTFPLGEPFDFFDQYLSLREVINKAVGYSLLICFITIFILLLCLVEGDAGFVKRFFATFWGAALTTGVIAMSVYQLFGYMAFAQLKISAIPAISIIMSTGVAVEYTAYTAVAFINGQGTMNERAEHSLMLMLAPVVDGGVTMFLGVVMLAASPFLFIVKYFFYPWLLIIFFGMFNGLAFLPVLFSLVGPPAVKSGSRTVDAGTSKEVVTKE